MLIPAPARVLIFCLFFCLSTAVQAQEPTLPTNQIQVSVSGVVRGPLGEAIPAAEVIIRSKDTGFITTTITDESGRFSKSGLVPGSYSVSVHVKGFAITQQDIVLQVGQAATLEIQLGSDVPEGTASGPSPGRRSGGASNPSSPSTGRESGGASRPSSQSGNRRVPAVAQKENSTGKFTDAIEMIFASDIELTDWLNSMKSQRKRLFRIIPGADMASLFVFENVKATTKFDYTVILVNEQLDSTHLLTRINQHSKKTFVGIHKLNSNSYLMVFYG